ncbi:MAG: peptidylprolyl isomerase [Sterolibacterium sp.]|jgi:cyclophilin family peptidyl-prolyl cis-trans isomerase
MKFIAILLCLIMLTACVGDGDTTPTVTDLQAKNLRYGQKAEFDFLGTYLDKGLSATIPNCTGQTPTFITPTHQVLTCTVTVVGDLAVEVRDGAGTVIFSKTFNVPAPRTTFITSMGNIVVELNPTKAPLTANNFLQYVQNGFYTNTLVHRVIAGYVIQGGGFAPGFVIKPGALAPISLESHNGLSNQRGTIGMARTPDPNSATSQFYFNVTDSLFLDDKDGGYAVFGKIIEGLDVMDAISIVPTAPHNGAPDFPVTDVVVKVALRTQ